MCETRVLQHHQPLHFSGFRVLVSVRFLSRVYAYIMCDVYALCINTTQSSCNKLLYICIVCRVPVDDRDYYYFAAHFQYSTTFLSHSITDIGILLLLFFFHIIIYIVPTASCAVYVEFYSSSSAQYCFLGVYFAHLPAVLVSVVLYAI